ncbi:MAG: phasin family protein [Undibacterium sp.]|nr:phasin family protein [Undibacterium sp.]
MLLSDERKPENDQRLDEDMWDQPRTENVMEKKLKILAKADDEKLVDAVLASAQQIWQAGLGAFSIAEQEGGKVFSKLVKEGTDMQKRTRRLAEIKVSGVTDSVTKMAGSMSKQASGSWDKIEQVFEDRVSRTLASLGVPTSTDIRDLTKRIEQLSQTVTALSEKKATPVKVSDRPVRPASNAKLAVKTAPKSTTRKSATSSASEIKKAVKPAIVKRKTAKPV